MALPTLLQLVVDFVRQGYPQGVPPVDYVPLFALLRRRLSEDEVAQIATDLDPDAGSGTIATAIGDLIRQEPSEADIARVRARLDAVGLDVDHPDGLVVRRRNA